jgi:quinol monooxygenase YgiN
MLVVHVFVHVKPESIEEFIQATIENAHSSLLEPGIVRFDVVQQDDDPGKFVLIEVYRALDDPSRHKETAHYARWSEVVKPMMAEPRFSVKYHNLVPEDSRLG